MGAAFQAAANVVRQQQGVAPGVPPVTAPNRFTRTRTRPIQPGGPQLVGGAYGKPIFGGAQPVTKQPGGPFVPRPDLGPGVGFGPGLPQPQLEAMPYTEPGFQPTQATQQNPNVSIGFGGGAGNVFGAPFSGIGSAFTRASQQPDMSEKDIQALQGFGQAFNNLGSSFASTMGSAMPLLGGKSQPAQPGGPFVPRPDLGPGVGFGPGLPQPQPMPNPEQSTFTQQINQGVSPIANAVGQPGYPVSVGGKSFGGPSMGFGAQAPIGQETNPQYQNYANYQGPSTGGFNPSLGNTTLPGNF